MAFTILSLCSGVGGLELGIKTARPDARVLCYVERDSFAAAILLARMEDKTLEPAPIWCGDIADCDLAPFAHKVDCLTAGFPCQPWSNAGKQRGEDDDRWIWEEVAECIRLVRPKNVFLENVPGLVAHNGLSSVLGALASLGYDAAWGSVRASGCGAPHVRERVFIMANAKRSRLPERKGVLGNDGSQRPPSQRIRLFPPGPSDIEGWREFLQSRPAAEPAICRTADGMAYRVDRLRACGNGVVPLQAAAAFIELSGRLDSA